MKPHFLILSLAAAVALSVGCDDSNSNNEDATPSSTPTAEPKSELTITASDVTFEHKYGVSDCPTQVAEVVIKNGTDTEASAYLILASSGLQPMVTDPANSTTIPAGGMTTVYLKFDCDKWDQETNSFSGTLKIEANAGEKMASKTIMWNGSVTGYPPN